METLNSRILIGRLMHARMDEKRHAFTYPVHMLWLDLEELPRLSSSIRWFGHNAKRLLSIHDRDYLTRDHRSIQDKLRDLLRERGVEWPGGRVMLLTCARYFNYVFNPVSFYCVYDPDDRLRCVVAEVNNTFTEKHLYVLDDSNRLPDEKGVARFKRDKAFHVSPFMDLGGDYDFQFSFPDNAMDINIDTIKQDQTAFRARLTGELLPFTARHMRRILIRHPLTGFLTMTRILVQAVKLYFRGATVYERPTPVAPDTIGLRAQAARPPWTARLVLKSLARFTVGRLTATLPDGTVQTFGQAQDGQPDIRMEIKDWRFFRKVVRDGDVGLGESYMAGDWTVDDLTGFMTLIIRNRAAVVGVDDGAWYRQWFYRALSWAKRNSIAGSKRNIAHHYDLSNELYTLMLDPTMTYSSAYYETPEQSLEEAQNAKYRRICEKIALKDSDHVLEIGCGWGGFATYAARHKNCRVTAITVSEEQYRYAVERVKRENLEGRVDIQLVDYRKLEGRYDKIVSIEMFEAVGYEYYGAYFSACERLLKPGGSFLMQVITVPDGVFDAYRRTYDWIRAYIFPGGLLPSIEALAVSVRKHSQLVIQDIENIGDHYAHTLRAWRARFDGNLDRVKALGFDVRFERMWRFYLCYCEAAFATRYLGDLQIVYSRPLRNETLPRV